MSTLDDLLSRLGSTSETQRPVTFEGRALSRDDDYLHLSVTSGVIAIPLADIEEVRPLVEDTPNLVSLDVREVGGIKHIRSVGPASPNQQIALLGGGLGGLGGLGGFASDTPTSGYIDSATVSGGRLDQTDDTWPISRKDDVIA